MDKKNLILLLAVLIVGAFFLIGGMFLLLTGTQSEQPPEIAEPVETLPDFGGDVTVPKEELEHQIDNVDKLGFEELSGYWVDKLKDVCDLPAELNKGQTLETLCEYYFPEEYKAYKEALLLGDENLEEYPEDMSDELYKELIGLAENRTYHEIKYRIEDLMQSYKFTLPYNYRIGDLYYDVMLLEEIDNMTSATRVKTIGKLKTPELQLIEAVRQSPKEQCCMSGNLASVVFEQGTHINILSVEKYTINPKTNDYHEKLMNEYYNTNQTDMPVVKIRFTVDYEQSPMGIDDFDGYFKFNEGEYILYDESGAVGFDMSDYSDSELKDFAELYPEYAEKINTELQRRKEERENPASDEIGNEEMPDGYMGSASAVVPEINQDEYDSRLFEEYKPTVFEAYITVYSLPKNTYNRIYIINQVDNLHIACLKSAQYHRDILKGSDVMLSFIYKNTWSKMNNTEELEGLQDELLGQGTPD
jgi:hypothetical protein